ncbi:Histidine kinase [Alteripontixanthobacter maritimus]|uniref:histidine kinase n=2 Tax=Alteripontixanthobacter maritimus TaxID=2161824 RepID=A0A369Q4K6_9SPHN|nr:Histidine kinase [Alteripontixanthobacter maritimus]
MAIAVSGCVGLLVLGVSWLVVAVLLLLWLASLLLHYQAEPKLEPPASSDTISRENLTKLMEHSSLPLLVADGDRVVEVNILARELLGDHLVGQDIRIALRHPDAIALIEGTKEQATVRGLIRRRDIWQINRQRVNGSLTVLELVNRTPEADIGRAHTDFVANASHELRTPLASIIGYAETLSEDGVPEEKRARFLDTITREARRMSALVEDLMSLSRVEAEKHDQPRAPINLSEIVERGARDGAGPQRSGRLDLHIAPHIEALGDSQQIEQLLRNLVDNALKYGDSEQPVTVSLTRGQRDMAMLTVKDRGPGIPAEHIPHLTRRFYRTDPGRSRASGGTGLGLAIVKHVIERHCGHMEIRSEVGVGTEVLIKLPTAASNG